MWIHSCQAPITSDYYLLEPSVCIFLLILFAVSTFTWLFFVFRCVSPLLVVFSSEFYFWQLRFLFSSCLSLLGHRTFLTLKIIKNDFRTLLHILLCKLITNKETVKFIRSHGNNFERIFQGQKKIANPWSKLPFHSNDA